MINRQSSQAGLTLLEVLVAILIFSITVLGFVDYQSTITAQLAYAKNRHLAEKAAFQLLDVYPDTILVNLPNQWQYQVLITQYSGVCKIVKVNIQPNLGEPITQVRWFCKP